MQIKDLFGNIFSLILVSLIVGAGALALNKFGGQGMPVALSTSLNTSATNFGGFLTDWMPLILLFIAIAVVIGLMINSVGGKR
jgi:hypothetical protein